MKLKGLYIVATAALLALVTAGCDKNPGEKTPQDKVTEAASPTEIPEATATPEPTATSAPTATPVAENYMEANGIKVLGAGRYDYQGLSIVGWDAAGNYVIESAACEAIFTVTEEENGDGTKTICATLHSIPVVNKKKGWSTATMGGFVDLKSGKAFFPSSDKMEQFALLKQGEKSYELRITFEYEKPSLTYPYYTEKYTVVCPADYEDAGFYLTGSPDNESYAERAGNWKLLNYIRHGESDLLVFGVNEGLATGTETEPVETPAVEEAGDGVHYFDKHGLTARGEGKHTYFGTVSTGTINPETKTYKVASMEFKKTEVEFSLSEEFPGDGTKIMTATFCYTPEHSSEGALIMPYSISGVVDKRTGALYSPRAYSLAEPHTVNGENGVFSLTVATETRDTMEEDGKIRVVYVVGCPEAYEDIAFYWTGYDRTLYLDTPTWSVDSIVRLKKGDSELLFFE